MKLHPAAATFAQYLFFALTGVGLVLPGALLPMLVQRWAWQDGRSGVLFFLFFVGTTLGAFLARGVPGRALVASACCIAFPLAALPYSGSTAQLAAFLMTGFGLGLAMTMVTLVRSRQQRDRRAAELTRLNLVWATGAASAPGLLLWSTSQVGFGRTLGAYSAAVLLSGLAAGASAQNTEPPAQDRRSAWKMHRPVSMGLIVTLPLATGVEAGVGAWLVTLTAREDFAQHVLIRAGSAFWAGLLVSRAVLSGSRLPRVLSRQASVLGCAGLLVCGLLLLTGHSASQLTAGAFCAGFGIGPLYPYLLALWLEGGEQGNLGFLLAGAGSALLPLLIGQVSQFTHSLRTGLLAPIVGSAVLFAALMRLPSRADA